MIPKVADLGVKRYAFERMVKNIRSIVLDKCNHKCVQCGATENLQVDHIIPLSFGGSNDLDNFQILCKPCNTSKGGRRMQKGEKAVPSYIISLLLPEDLKAKAKKQAEREGRTLSNLIIQAIKAYLK